MGIGVSYTGYDGKTRHAQANSAADLPRIMGEASRSAKSALSIGESQMPFVSASFGKKEEYDPVDGPLIGNEGEEAMNEDGMSRPVGSKGGWRIPISRTEETQEWDSQEQAWKIVLAKFQFDLIISEKGYVKGRSVERKVWEKEFVAKSSSGEGGTASAMYSSRAFWSMDSGDHRDRPHLDMISFGTESDLDTWNDSEKRFDCNYDENGNLKENPPVKVVKTADYG